MPGRHVSRPAAQKLEPCRRAPVEPAAQAREQRLRREELETRRSQFNGERQALKTKTNLGDCRRIVIVYLEIRFDGEGALNKKVTVPEGFREAIFEICG